MSEDPKPLTVRLVEAGHDDPDRLMALRITNFLGNMDIRRVIAIYSLAMSMSFRQIEISLQHTIMRAICEACFKTWANWRGEPEPDPCGDCGGSGTTDGTLETFETCPTCKGTGAAT